jgi:hypothetical protein
VLSAVLFAVLSAVLFAVPPSSCAVCTSEQQVPPPCPPFLGRRERAGAQARRQQRGGRDGEL